ncbi:MAG TPA: hypothetical protein VGM80_06015 [Gaiellaceae bacterium]
MTKLKGRTQGARRAFGTAALMWNLWRRLPSSRRRQVIGLARKHGPKVVKGAYKARRTVRRTRRG